MALEGVIPSNLFVAKMESLYDDLAVFEAKTGIKPVFHPSDIVSSNHLRKKIPSSSKPQISSEVKKSVLKHYLRDFDVFSYDT
ncbi:hypothetical protein SynBMKMC1_00293 [Synechococcus sp. BMK-MC-1]|nr:hypothetical protein SynBMKMC1_00293 [Synechococcus sp. BMK-MC-1]